MEIKLLLTKANKQVSTNYYFNLYINKNAA